jgi:hypothetical protein
MCQKKKGNNAHPNPTASKHSPSPSGFSILDKKCLGITSRFSPARVLTTHSPPHTLPNQSHAPNEQNFYSFFFLPHCHQSEVRSAPLGRTTKRSPASLTNNRWRIYALILSLPGWLAPSFCPLTLLGVSVINDHIMPRQEVGSSQNCNPQKGESCQMWNFQ